MWSGVDHVKWGRIKWTAAGVLKMRRTREQTRPPTRSRRLSLGEQRVHTREHAREHTRAAYDTHLKAVLLAGPLLGRLDGEAFGEVDASVGLLLRVVREVEFVPLQDEVPLPPLLQPCTLGKGGGGEGEEEGKRIEAGRG